MNFGLEKRHFHILDRLAVQPLKSAGARVWIFGSRARGDHKPFSDVDLLFEWAEAENEKLKLISGIREELENSELPFKVDLVNRRELAESYRTDIERDKIAL
jgi:predicted nucleotidyltransferase